MTTTIHVDFNDLVRDGQELGYLDQVDGDIVKGAEVTAVDDAEGLTFQATVAAIEGDEVYLMMHWRPRDSEYDRTLNFGDVVEPRDARRATHAWIVSWGTPSHSSLLTESTISLRGRSFERRVATRNERRHFARSFLA